MGAGGGVKGSERSAEGYDPAGSRRGSGSGGAALHERQGAGDLLPDCHESLAGIVAGSIRERYNKPVFVLTHSEEGAKGSGRSIEAYHMFHGLVEVQDLLSKFGGHPMAAGFSLPLEHVEEFRRRLNENARLTEEDFIPKVWIDIAQPFENVGEELIGELERLEPFGQGNEKPQFALKDLFIRSARVMGKTVMW